MLFVEQTAHEGFILGLRHRGDVSEGTELMVILLSTTSVGAQDLHPTRHLLPYLLLP